MVTDGHVGWSRFLSVDPLASVTGSPYGYTNDNPVNESDPTGLAFDPRCASLPAGDPQAACDVGLLYSEEYGPVDSAGVATLAAVGAAGGATLGAAVGGPIAPVTGVVGGVVGGIGGAITGLVEGNRAANGYLSAGYIESSADVVLNVIYLDNFGTEPSPSEIAQMGGTKTYEWVVIAQSREFQWFSAQLTGKLAGNALLGVLGDYIKSAVKTGASLAAYTGSMCLS